MTPDELTVSIESLREYRLRVVDGMRRAIIDRLIVRLQLELAKGADAIPDR